MQDGTSTTICMPSTLENATNRVEWEVLPNSLQAGSPNPQDDGFSIEVAPSEARQGPQAGHVVVKTGIVLSVQPTGSTEEGTRQRSPQSA